MRVTIDVSQVERLADRLAGLTAVEIARQNVRALNETMDRTYDLSRDRITTGVNLSDEYLRRRMTTQPATEQRPTAEITASGARNAMSRLVTYPVAARPAPKKSMRSRRKVFSPMGIGMSQKQDGIDVSVVRGSENYIERGFLMPLKSPGEDSGYHGFGVFARTRAGKIKQRYGPSVYQLFRYQINSETFIQEVEDDLERSLMDTTGGYIEKALR